MSDMDQDIEKQIALRINHVWAQIGAAENSAGRVPGSTNLIAVSKTFDTGAIIPALEAGHRQFGENRVQEAHSKWPELKARFPDVTLHLIGPLQTNKVADAVALFDAIHTLDRPKLARALVKEFEKQVRTPDLFVQVNTGAEPQKSGIMPQDVDGFIADVRDMGLKVCGLMCIPPFDDEPSTHFALLKKIADRNGLARLSMGMSHDYESAIAFGATDVRVGSAIFGPRGVH